MCILVLILEMKYGGNAYSCQWITSDRYICLALNTSLRSHSPFPDDLVGVFGHMIVTDHVIHTGQSFVHILLQSLQILSLLMNRDYGVLQLHQTALKRGQDGHLEESKHIHGFIH